MPHLSNGDNKLEFDEGIYVKGLEQCWHTRGHINICLTFNKGTHKGLMNFCSHINRVVFYFISIIYFKGKNGGVQEQ